jgi:hypothetical protein
MKGKKKKREENKEDLTLVWVRERARARPTTGWADGGGDLVSTPATL